MAASDSSPCNGSDQFEPDDDAEHASEFAQFGTVQSHTFHIEGDQDWLKVPVEEGKLYTFQTAHPMTATVVASSVLWLYDEDGFTPIAYSDRSPQAGYPWAAAASLPGFVLRSQVNLGGRTSQEAIEDVRLEWRSDHTGTVYLGIEPMPGFFTSSYGVAARYMVYVDEFEQIFLPLIRANP